MKLSKSKVFRLHELHAVMLAMLTFLIFVGFTIASIKTPLAIPEYEPDSSRLGYTLSLAMVWGPIAILLFWFTRHPEIKKNSLKAFWLTVCSLVPVWTLLDLLAAPSMFQFPNCFATLQIYWPGWIPGEGFTGKVPIEEIFFYLGSCILMLMIYIWGNLFLFKKQQIVINSEEVRRLVPLVRFDYKVLLIGAGVLGFTYIYRFFIFDGQYPSFPAPLLDCRVPAPKMSGGGFPLYFTILFTIVFTPAVMIWHRAWPSVNPAALFFTIVVAVLFSLVWEATLAIPYGWWNYNPRWMMGVFIDPWYNLPVEAVCLWLLAGWGAILIYEFFRMVVVSGLPLFSAALGVKSGEDVDDQNS